MRQSLTRCPESNPTICEAVRSNVRCTVFTRTSMYAVSQLGSPIRLPVTLALNGWLRLPITRRWRLRSTRHERRAEGSTCCAFTATANACLVHSFSSGKNCPPCQVMLGKYFIARVRNDNRPRLFFPYGIRSIAITTKIRKHVLFLSRVAIFKLLSANLNI